MNKLRKTARVVQHSEEWREMLEAACMLNAVPYTAHLATSVTYQVIDNIQVDDTLEIDVSAVSEEDVINAVKQYTPPNSSEQDETPASVEQRLNQLETNIENINEIKHLMLGATARIEEAVYGVAPDSNLSTPVIDKSIKE